MSIEGAAEDLADGLGADTEAIKSELETLRKYDVPLSEAVGTIRRRFENRGGSQDATAHTSESCGEADNISIFTDADPEVGDAIAVRAPPVDDRRGGRVAENTYIAAGEVVSYTAPEESSEHDCLLGIDPTSVWTVSEAAADPVKLDYGPTIDYRYDDGRRAGSPEDWDGPSVCVSIGRRGDIVVRNPDPVWDSSGVRYYASTCAGPVVSMIAGPLVSPVLLLEDEERPPRGGFK